MQLAIIVNEHDNVATALQPLDSGTEVLGVTLKEAIPKGHKFAIRTIKKGEPLLKYASHIGLATMDITPGQWVHVHNIEGERGRGDTDKDIQNEQVVLIKDKKAYQSDHIYKLKGYRRPDGKLGLRNHILIIPSVHCANKVVEQIANSFIYQNAGRDDTRVKFVTHQHGCSQLDFDAKQTQDVFAGTGANPNVFGVLIIGLGCEVIQSKSVAAQIKAAAPYKMVEYFTIQDVGGQQNAIQKGKEIVAQMLEEALKQTKSVGSLADIILGTECGGSDSFSGLSANPALGAAADVVIQQGGAAILAETTELIGAEHILARRANTPEVRDQIFNVIKTFEEAVLATGSDIRGANPSPGNIAGGLSSIEEKSLGCIYKAGNQPVMDVVGYAQPVVSHGMTLMNTPGNDIEQLSGMVAGGCNICVFTTGRGTPTGSPIVPTIKMSTNTEMANNMSDCIDLNAGQVLEGTKTIKQMGEEILDCIVRVSEGELVKAEINNQNDFSVWRLATTV